MLALTIASYTKKNTNSKIGVQGVVLVGTNEMIIMRRLRMSPIKRVKKGKDERGRMPLPMRTLKALKREKICSCDVVPTYDRPLEAYVLKPKGC
jgi:hypothetical protein